MAGKMATETAPTSSSSQPGPWRLFPSDAPSPDLTGILPSLTQATVKRLWGSARRELRQYVKTELQYIERRAQQSGRAVSGFRPGEWSDAKIVTMILAALGRSQRITSAVAVMLVELDPEIERQLAASLADHSVANDPESPLLVDDSHAISRYMPIAEAVARAFYNYGGSRALQPETKRAPPPLSAPLGSRADALADELTTAHAALVVATTALCEVVDRLAVAQPVARDRATASLDETLLAATRLRGCLAEAALLTPEASRHSVSADELATIVSEAAASLQALALPSGRSQLGRLAQELASGRITTKNPVRRTSLERTRSAAATEAAEGLTNADEQLAGFPGPSDETSWLTWFWTIATTGNDDEALRISNLLEERWPQIHRFLSNVDANDWAVESDAASRQSAPSEVSHAPHDAPTLRSRSTVAELEDYGARPAIESALLSNVRDSEEGEKSLLIVNRDVPDVLLVRGGTETDLSATIETSLATADTIVSVGSDVAAGDDSAVKMEAVARGTGAPAAETAGHSDGAGPSDQDVAGISRAVAQASGWIRDSNELELPTFAVHVNLHWIDQRGVVGPAPWTRPDFLEAAGSALTSNLWSDNWSTALLIARALEQLGSTDAPSSNDLELARGFRAGRWPPSEEEQSELVARVRGLLAAATFPNDTRHRLLIAITLAARQALHVLTEEETEQLVEFSGFSSRLSSFLLDWARVARRFPAPFAALARQLRAEGPSPIDELRRAESEARDSLRCRLKEFHSAAGNKVQRTHCRAAWDEFITEARPIFERVINEPSNTRSQAEVGRLQRRAAKIFDRHEARYQDRSVMDRAVDGLLEAASRVFRAASSLSTAATATSSLDAFPASVTQVLLHEEIGGGSDEERWLLSLFREALGKRRSSAPRLLDRVAIARRPWLLSAWPPSADPFANADPSQCLDPRSATAYLLCAEPLSIEPASTRQWVFEHAPWLLAHFSSLNERERAAAEDFHRRQRDLVDASLAALRRYHLDLANLADQNADRVFDIINQIEQAAISEYRGVPLVSDWANLVTQRVAEHVSRMVQSVAATATQLGGLKPEEVAELVKHRRYANLHLCGPRTMERGDAVRATAFRRDAEGRWPNARRALLELAREAELPANEHLRALIHDWCHVSKFATSPPGSEKQKQLRDHFLEVMLDLTPQKRRTKVATSKGAHRFSCSDVVAWLPSSAQTPTFLPQIHRFSEVVVKVLAVSQADRSLSNKAHLLGEDGAITIVLAPGLPATLREEISRTIRQSPGKPIAILDDLDVCRILNPGGAQPHLLEALIEIAVEQQRWNEFGPYEVQEGQHVRMEMYVGRRPEAERLVNGTTYSRIFSGRRLGKTALLRYVEHRYDRTLLASGKTLRVLYVPIVGMGSEHEVVDEIVSKLEAVSGINVVSHGGPRSRIKEAVRCALERKPGESYLVFLDEADTFFESQTDANATARADYEASLSWTMRDCESEKDSRGFPRIRFVVCGYRATNRSEGAWGNWGDVLLLNPLEPSDAVRLVTGPLARLGVDARDQADGVAFRCGYQPAVIVYFCTRLLAELERRTAFTERDMRVVRPEDVVAVFQLPEVQDRVRETVWLNFVGDPLGQLTFAAFLAEAETLAPGAPIEDAPQRILAHVTRETDEQTLAHWTAVSWQDLGARHLRDLVKRSLLAEAEHHPLALRLRFPHQLPILLQERPKLRIRDALARLGASRSTSGPRAEWLVADDVLENVRWALSNDEELGVRAIVFGSHWPEPLLNRSGLQHRLPPNRVLAQTATSDDLMAQDRRARVLVGGVSLLREALHRQRDMGMGIEVARLGRFSEDAIDGYFKRSRGVEFSSPGALQSIVAATGGIPLVIARFSVCFPKEATVDGAQLDEALRVVKGALPELAREMIVGPPERRLQRRENELLIGVLAASRLDASAVDEILGASDLLHDALVNLVQDIPEDGRRELDIEPLGPGDNERIALLLNIGLLVRRRLPQAPGWALSEVAPIPDGDVLWSLLPYVLGTLAA